MNDPESTTDRPHRHPLAVWGDVVIGVLRATREYWTGPHKDRPDPPTMRSAADPVRPPVATDGGVDEQADTEAETAVDGMGRGTDRPDRPDCDMYLTDHGDELHAARIQEVGEPDAWLTSDDVREVKQ